MRIEHIDRGFVQYFDNDVIEKIIWVGDYVKVENANQIIIDPKLIMEGKVTEWDKIEYVGTCTIHYHHKPPKEFNHISFDGYNSQYGMPVSTDGSKLFIGSWEKTLNGVKRGLRAYDIESGALLWRLNEGKIRNIFVYSDYLIAIQADVSVFKIDINSGEVLEKIKSGTIEQQFEVVGSPYIFVDSIGGKLSIVDPETMLVIKKYHRQLPGFIKSVHLQDNILTVTVFRVHSNSDGSDSRSETSVVLDPSFSKV